MTYAENTTVAVEKSRAEIERTLQRYGADTFAYGWNDDGAAIQFRAHGKHVKFMLPLPDRRDRKFTHGKPRSSYSEAPLRSELAAHKLWEQACRQRWRALALVVKAKLEAVEADISEFETEFMGHIVLPDGQTVAEWLRPQIDEAYESGQMPATLVLALPAGSADQ